MKNIPQYKFHKTKYGDELLIDIVELKNINKYILKHPVHSLSYFDITFVTEGMGNFKINDKQYSLQSNDVIFSIPGEIRVWDEENIPEGYALIFEEEFLSSFFNDSIFVHKLSFFDPQRPSSKINIAHIKPRTDGLIQNIISEINDYQSKDKHILRAQLYETLMLLNREYNKLNYTGEVEDKAINRHISSFISLVDKYFKTQHTIQYYADKLCISPNYLNELTQQSMKVSAKTYIQNRIITEAKKQLLYTSSSISEICENLGFNDTSYFIRLFRSKVQLTPLQYRNNQKP